MGLSAKVYEEVLKMIGVSYVRCMVRTSTKRLRSIVVSLDSRCWRLNSGVPTRFSSTRKYSSSIVSFQPLGALDTAAAASPRSSKA